MDDKNNELIDFSNQPLGLMAQEGAEIEKQVNSNTVNNMQPASNPNVQDNPFADIPSPQAREQKKEEVVIPVEPVNPPSAQQPVEQTPIVQVEGTPAAPTEEQPGQNVETIHEEPIVPEMSPEEKKQQEINEFLAGEKGSVQPQEPDPNSSNASFIVFIILAVLVAGAIYMFKSGKLDSLLDKGKEETKTEEKVSQDEENGSNEEESTINEDGSKKEEQGNQVPQVPESVKTFSFKETIYTLSDKYDIYYTTTGTVNTDTKMEKGNVVINVNGHISQTMDEYTDFNKGVYYMYLSVDKTKGWYKESVEKNVFNPEKIITLLNTFNKEYKGDGEYNISIEGDDLKNLLKDANNEYIDIKKLAGKKITVNYTVENGYLKKTKYDMSQLIPGIKKAYVVQEFYDYNKEADIKIPDEVIKVAKTTKDFKIG